MVKKVVLWALVISCMITIFSFSGQDGSQSQAVSDGLLAEILSFLGLDLPERAINFLSVFIRKTAHFAIYALLGALICLLMKVGYEKQGKKCFVVPCIVSALYAITDEFHQFFISGRSGQISDVFLDTSGAVFGILTALGVCAIIARRKRND